MDVAAALMGLALTLLVLSVLVAFVVRVTRRRRELPSTSTTEAVR
jgi:ABC-type phosphate transport system permease subunit